MASSGSEAGAPILIRQIPDRTLLQRLAEDSWGSDSLAWSPDGKLLAAGSARDATIRIWDVSTGERLLLLRTSAYPHTFFVHNPVVVAFTVDGKSLLSVDPKGVFQFWDSQTGEETGRIALDHKPDPSFATARSLDVSADGKFAAVTLIAGRLWLVDLGERKATQWIDGGAGWLVEAKFSPDSRTLYWSTNASEDDLKPGIGVRAWDLATKTLRTQFLPDASRGRIGFGNGFAPSHDGTTLVLADYLTSLVAYDTTKGKQRWDVRPGRSTSGPRTVAITPDDRLVVTDWAGGSLRFWRLADGQEVEPVDDYDAFDIKKLAVSADGSRLFAAAELGEMEIWDTASGKKLNQTKSAQHTDHSNPSLRAIVPEANSLVFGEFPGTNVYLLNMVDQKQVALSGFKNAASVAEYTQGASAPVVLSQTGAYLAAVTRKIAYAQAGAIRVWEVNHRKLLHEWPIGDQEFATLAITPDGGTLVIGRQANLGGRMLPLQFEVVDTASGKSLRRFSVQGNQVVAQQPQISPDGRWIVLAGFRDQVHFWDLAKGEYRGYLSGHRPSLALSETVFSPSGNRLAALGAPGAMTSSLTMVDVWDLTTGRHTHRFEQPVRSACFSPDGNRLYLATAAQSILTFDLTQGLSDLPTRPAALTAAEVAELWSGLGGSGEARLGTTANMFRTDLIDRLAAAGDEVLPLLRPLFDVPLEEETKPLLAAAATLRSDDAAARRAAATVIGNLGDTYWVLVRDVARQPLTEAQFAELTKLLRQVPRQRRIQVLDGVASSLESPAAGQFLKELAQSMRTRGGPDGPSLARFADGVHQRWKPFRPE